MGKKQRAARPAPAPEPSAPPSPAPQNPVTIALDSEANRLAISFVNGRGKRNTIRVKLDLDGLRAIYDILKVREREAAEPVINHPGTPTQALVDAFIKKGGRIETEDMRAEREFAEKNAAFEEKYGVSIEDLLT